MKNLQPQVGLKALFNELEEVQRPSGLCRLAKMSANNNNVSTTTFPLFSRVLHPLLSPPSGPPTWAETKIISIRAVCSLGLSGMLGGGPRGLGECLGPNNGLGPGFESWGACLALASPVLTRRTRADMTGDVVRPEVKELQLCL